MSARQFGWCLSCDIDVPVDEHRRCLTDQSVCIPPSWGSKDQTWIAGAWSPDKPRPEGYVYVRPKHLTAVPSVQETPKPEAPTVCGQCGIALEVKTGGGNARAYCSPLCKNRASNKRKLERLREATSARQAVPVACEHCHATFIPDGRRRQRYCSESCRSKAAHARRASGARRALAPAEHGSDFTPIMVTVVCAHCGESTERPRMQQARFCSVRCRTLNEQQRKREARAS